LDTLYKKYPEKDSLYNELMKLVEDKGNEKQTKEEETQVRKKGGKKSSAKESKNKDRSKDKNKIKIGKKGEEKDEQNYSLKTVKKEGKKDGLKDGKKKGEKEEENDLLNSREKLSIKSCEKKFDTKKKGKDDLLKSGQKESEEESNNNNPFKNVKKKPGRNWKNSIERSRKRVSENSLKDSFSKSKKRGDDLEVKHELSRSIKIENMANKYRLSKRHSANKKRLSAHHYKNQTIGLFEVKNFHPIRFEDLFLDITKYAKERKKKNPFEGPSPYTEFYKERRIKIKKKIIQMASGDIDDNIEIKLDENKIKEEENKEE